jgi:predicted nucleic acid-binding protein
MVSFDTNILVYATLSVPLAKTDRARDLLVRGMRTGSCILLLQTLAEFSSVAIRKAGIAVDEVRTTIDAWERCYLCRAPRMTISRRRSMR